MDICFEGIGQTVATFAAKKELASGLAVTLTGNGEVGLDENGGPLCGVTVNASRGGAVAVQIGGVVKVGCSDSSLKHGYTVLACDKDGCIKTADEETNGKKFLVLSVAEDGKSAVIRL